ncbi:methylenetetrahydrofolate reductase [Allorhizobium sp. BGMRC 0089]|uniref:methylenetetrahydrofolate reductase n=1 Tax=Allorhizobium sonneratiae TaxID=2934936 RepID=UPI00203484D0|nr:methylenetetrahydrofolate reductase [Allorhizobium sonneratiae]MCM2293098.1 methylenetetrahydrofolate reductase [Allorhizobium sonneratiae]
MAFMNFEDDTASLPRDSGRANLHSGWSIEVMPRTAAKISDFKPILPEKTRIYIAHIGGTPIDDMVETARRLRQDGFAVMPHLPARAIADRTMLELWLNRYRSEADVTEALLLGGGDSRPAGDFDSSIQMIETGFFDRFGFKRLHVAGHPEGSRDIDKDGSTRNVDQSLLWKTGFASRTDAAMAIVTQFAFDAQPVIDWSERIRDLGVTLPIHVGLAGPAKLKTLLQYAVTCGVGPSLKVLQKRALDVTRLLSPYEPTEVADHLMAYKNSHPDSLISQFHLFPLGGIVAAVEWARRQAAI